MDSPLPPRDYGDEAAEYRAARETVAIVDRSDQAQLRMWGRDPVKMLHGLITNDLAAAPAGRAVYAAMLTPKGRMIAELRALVLRREGATELLIDVPREALAGISAQLGKFVPPMFARWEVSAGTGAIGVYGPRAAELLGLVAEGEIPGPAEDDFAELTVAGEPVIAVATRYAGGEPGYDLIAATAALPALRASLLERGEPLGARAMGHAALDALRIEAGRPRYGRELSEEVIPTEAYESSGLMTRAISFNKGCYTGQEVIVRIAHRGHVNRQLRGLRLGESASPSQGTPLFAAEGGKEVGRITSAARSPLLGESVALGYVRREVEPGQRVRLGSPEGPEATVSTLPFAARD
jgi:folate-binding protein YgfZ